MLFELGNTSSLDFNNTENVSNDKDQKVKQKWFKNKDKVNPPYIPVAVWVDRDFPSEVKETLYNIISKLIAKGITIRINGDDKDFIKRIQSLSDTNIEIYIPWKKFNDIDSKHYYNTATSKDIVAKHFPGYDKVPDSVKALLARNVRMIFGDRNNSIALCLITWSKDGACRLNEITKDTGKSSFIIRTASFYGFPVINIAREGAENVLEKTFYLNGDIKNGKKSSL